MRKGHLAAFINYTMEMATFLLVLLFLYTISRSIFPLMEYILWLAFVYFSGVLPLLFIKEQWKKWWLCLHVLIIILSGHIFWEFTLLELVVLVLVPFWRFVTLLKAPVRPSLFINRFILLMLTVLFCYLYIVLTVTVVKTDTTVLNKSLPYFMWTQFFVLLGGLTWMYFITMREWSGVTLKKWIKDQSLTALLGLGMIVIVGASFFILPVLQFVVLDMPGLVFDFLASERMFVALDSVVHFVEKFRGIPKDAGGGELVSGCDHCPEQDEYSDETANNQWIRNLLLPVLQVIAFLVVGGLIYIVLKKAYFLPEEQAEKSGEHRFSIDGTPEKKDNRTKWAKDEVRRLYQSLLVHIRKKEEALKQSNTAREWSQRFAEREPQVWQKINQMYEQKRYSKIPLSVEDIKEYKQEIKQAKREVDLYYSKQKEKK